MLIALAIVAMSVGALLGTVTSSASNVIYLKDKTLAEWVALNRLTEIRIAQQMPDTGKRTGNSVMGGMRWQWEEEVIELPVKGMFRIDVRAHATGETVDDSQPVRQAHDAEADAELSRAAASLDKLSWTTTVTGVVGTARSDRHAAIAPPLRGQCRRTTIRAATRKARRAAIPGHLTRRARPARPARPAHRRHARQPAQISSARIADAPSRFHARSK